MQYPQHYQYSCPYPNTCMSNHRTNLSVNYSSKCIPQFLLLFTFYHNRLTILVRNHSSKSSLSQMGWMIRGWTPTLTLDPIESSGPRLPLNFHFHSPKFNHLKHLYFNHRYRK